MSFIFSRSEYEDLNNEFLVGAEQEVDRISQPEQISQPSIQCRDSITESVCFSLQDDNYERHDTGGQNNERLEVNRKVIQIQRTRSHDETIENGVVISNILHENNNTTTYHDMTDNIFDFRDTFPQKSNDLPTTNPLSAHTSVWMTSSDIHSAKREKQNIIQPKTNKSNGTNDFIHLDNNSKWNRTEQRTSKSNSSQTLVPTHKNTIKNSIPQTACTLNHINELVDVDSRKASIQHKEPKTLAAPLFANILSGEFNEYLDGVYLVNCKKETDEFKMIEKEFMKTTQKHFRVLKVEKIVNPYMRASYLIRKKEYELLYGSVNVKEKLTFHGTEFNNTINIVTWNFNWRLMGKSKGHIFGKGISFTPISNYASNYSDKKTEKKYMFVVSMLECFRCEGCNNMLIPPVCDRARVMCARYDTSGKPNGHVLVKYRDDEFYPSYMIAYNGITIKKI